MGEVNADVLRDLALRILEVYQPLIEDCRVGETLEMPPSAYDPERKQYRADAVLEHVRKEIDVSEDDRILAVASDDLYTPDKNFVTKTLSLDWLNARVTLQLRPFVI